MSRKYTVSPDGDYYFYMVPDEDYDQVETEELEGHYKVFMDYDAQGRLVGVELLGVSR